MQDKIIAEPNSNKDDRADLLHAGADIYLDPFPMTGSISALEAGLRGAVIVNFCPWKPYHRTFCMEGKDYRAENMKHSRIMTCGTIEDYQAALLRLILDKNARRKQGKR